MLKIDIPLIALSLNITSPFSWYISWLSTNFALHLTLIPLSPLTLIFKGHKEGE